ncbi:hypothetical protein AMECASPLE_027360 [Ameca splendens]|uniref:Uncharacterized protein n=1 Tax=Ameca splendens TaxID=208324 RepID=A0ABV0YGJ0_9TELE
MSKTKSMCFEMVGMNSCNKKKIQYHSALDGSKRVCSKHIPSIPVQIVSIQYAGKYHSLSHNSQSNPKTAKAKLILDVSSPLLFDKCVEIVSAVVQKGKRLRWTP